MQQEQEFFGSLLSSIISKPFCFILCEDISNDLWSSPFLLSWATTMPSMLWLCIIKRLLRFSSSSSSSFIFKFYRVSSFRSMSLSSNGFVSLYSDACSSAISILSMSGPLFRFDWNWPVCRLVVGRGCWLFRWFWKLPCIPFTIMICFYYSADTSSSFMMIVFSTGLRPAKMELVLLGKFAALFIFGIFEADDGSAVTPEMIGTLACPLLSWPTIYYSSRITADRMVHESELPESYGTCGRC